MTTRLFRRVLIVALLAASMLGVSGARGQDGTQRDTRIAVRKVNHEPRATKPDGMSVTTERNTTVARMNIPVQSTVTRECTTEPGAETKLGVLENSTVYGHCGTIP